MNKSLGLVLAACIFDLISGKKFQANGINKILSRRLNFLRRSIQTIAQPVPGVNFPCFSGLSSMIKSSCILLKLSKVLPLAAAP